MQTIILSVKGMSCSGCARNVESAVSGLPGAGAVKAEVKAKSVEVVYDENILSLDKIKTAIESKGFTVA